MVRADMDALPMAEESEHDFCSEYPGVMHACGHDGHTAIGMGVASLPARDRNEIAGTVNLVFQPAEEGLGGAGSPEEYTHRHPKLDFDEAVLPLGVAILCEAV